MVTLWNFITWLVKLILEGDVSTLEGNNTNHIGRFGGGIWISPEGALPSMIERLIHEPMHDDDKWGPSTDHVMSADQEYNQICLVKGGTKAIGPLDWKYQIKKGFRSMYYLLKASEPSRLGHKNLWRQIVH